MYDALDSIQKKLNKDPVEVFLKALENAKPVVEVKFAQGRRRDAAGTGGDPDERRDGRHAVDHFIRPSAAREDHVRQADRGNRRRVQIRRVPRLRKKKIPTRWLRANKAFAHYAAVKAAARRWYRRSLYRRFEYRHHGPHRCPVNDDDGAHPVLYGTDYKFGQKSRRAAVMD